MALHKLNKLSHYVRYLEQNNAEVKALYQDLVICVSSFFRDPEVFEALKSELFPQILENISTNFPLRVWVPGCSTGEKVFSPAISLLECLGDRAANVPIQIFGTDISETAVDKARAGIYPEDIEADVSPERLRRFFNKGEMGYQVSKPIRDLCVFARQNVFKDPPFSNRDLISCRNVLIYFGPELQKKVLPIFHYALNPNGFLLLGNSESIGGFADLFAPAHKRHKIYSKKSVSPRMVLDLTRSEYGMEKQGTTPSLHEGLPKPFDPQKESDRLLLERYSPPGVPINGDMNILQFRGRTGLFMEPAPGGASFNLLRMAREELMVPLHTAIREADIRGVTVRKEDVLFKGNGENYRVDIEVIPISNPAGAKEKFFLVLFQNAGLANGRQTHPVSESHGATDWKPHESEQDEEYERLKQELTATKEYLKSVIESQEAFNEELRSANEEILSSNEELQSTNEELESAKEELQTCNLELAKVNDDLTNLLNSTNIAIVMLDNELRVRCFTPCAETLFNLIPSDIGRPFGDINPRVDVPNFVPYIQDVLDTLSTKELEVKDGDGRWYNLRVRPYKTMDKKIDGAVLALLDIDALKHSLKSLNYTTEALKFAEGIIETVREPLVLLTADFRLKSANQSFYRTFGVAPDVTLDSSLFSLANGQWDIPELRAALRKLVENGTPFENFEVAPVFPNSGYRRLLLNARRFALQGDKEFMIVLAIEDLTDVAKKDGP